MSRANMAEASLSQALRGEGAALLFWGVIALAAWLVYVAWAMWRRR
jgi:hypothetical protein